MIVSFFIITLIYLFLIGLLVFGFNKVSVFKLEDLPSKTKFSIVIPFRNEAENLPDLLKSIKTLNYPKQLFEIILVNDDSEDDSVEVIQKVHDNTQKGFDCSQPDILVIQNNRKTNSPKKDAITSAVKKAKYDWIITTDADCQLPEFWLDSFDEFIQKNNPSCIAAPVTYASTNSFLNRFQLLDMLSLQGATIGGFGINKPFLCNGANFGYKKASFIEVNGFDENTTIASGDDIFLLEKITKKHPKQVAYLKCDKAVVTTSPQPNWKSLISQRIRWAAKTSAYNNWFGKLTGGVVLLMNALIVVNILLTFMAVINYKTTFYIFIIKFSIDFLLIFKSATFFNQKHILISYIFGFIIYPFFSVYVACISSFSGYKWKGRHFKK